MFTSAPVSPRLRRAACAALLIALLLPMVRVQHVVATTHCVNIAGSDGCFSTIQAAIDDAGTLDGDIINVGANNPFRPTYKEKVVVGKSVTLTGAGSLFTVIEGRDNNGGSVLTIPSGKSLHVSGMTIQGNYVTRDGTLTVTDGRFISSLVLYGNGDMTISNSPITGGVYGGIYNYGGTVTLTNSPVDGDVFNNSTGAMTLVDSTVTNSRVGNNTSGPLTFTRCTIDAAVYNAFGPLTLTDSIVNGYVFNGGALPTYPAGHLTLTNTTINGVGLTGVSYIGSNIYNGSGGTATLTNSVVRYARSTSSPVTNVLEAGRGGGIFNGGSMTVTNSTIDHNSADRGGGGIFNAGTLTVIGSTIEHNSVSNTSPINGGGGGIYNDTGSTVTVINSTLTANATDGSVGGGFFSVANARLVNDTISGNDASQGGGIANYGSLSVSNTISAGNTASAGGPDVSGVIASGGHNLIGNTSGGSGFVASDLQNVNPQLLPLANNGGPTQTMALLSTSPAAGAGDPAICAAPPPNGAGGIDQRGVARSASRCSIGSYESTVTPLPPSKPTAPAGGSPTALPPPRPTVPGPGAGTPTPNPLPVGRP